MDKVRAFIRAAIGDSLWAVILIPVLAISWIGFYTVARAVGVPPVFAAGMSAAFDGVALFAARIGLKHRRKGFSGYLARITVIAFACLGAFVQSFHAETRTWITAHSWIVWATAPVAAVICYELHLGWVNRKQLIRKGYHHPSAKSGFGPATWIHFPRGTWNEYRTVLCARRTYIAKSNLDRFTVEEAAQPKQKVQLETARKPKPTPTPEPAPQSERALHVVPSPRRKPKAQARSTSRPARRPTTKNQVIRDWLIKEGWELGYNNRIPIAGLNAYRAAHRSSALDASARVG